MRKKKVSETNDFEEYDSSEVNKENEQYYDESGFSSYKDSKSMTKLIIALVLVVLFVILVVVIIFSVSRKPKLNDVNITLDDVIYLNEENDLVIDAVGTGSIDKTVYTLSVDNENVSLADTNLTGKGVTTKVRGSKIGSTILSINASVSDKSISKDKKVFVCKRLSNESLNTSDVNLSINGAKIIDIDLGVNAECYKNIIYTSSDSSIAAVDNYGTIIGVSKGTSSITVSDGSNQYSINVVVR